MKTKILGLLAAMLLVGPIAANAVPVTWYLDGWLFGDGGSASGQFVFDADTGLYSGISITTTAGSAFTGATYGIPHPNSPGNPDIIVSVPQLPFDGGPLLVAEWLSSLTNAGGTVGIDVAGYSFEGVAVGDLGVIFSRGFLQGTITTTVPSVPEPGTLALLGLGLAGLGLSRRRKAA